MKMSMICGESSRLTIKRINPSLSLGERFRRIWAYREPCNVPPNTFQHPPERKQAFLRVVLNLDVV